MLLLLWKTKGTNECNKSCARACSGSSQNMHSKTKSTLLLFCNMFFGHAASTVNWIACMCYTCTNGTTENCTTKPPQLAVKYIQFCPVDFDWVVHLLSVWIHPNCCGHAWMTLSLPHLSDWPLPKLRKGSPDCITTRGPVNQFYWHACFFDSTRHFIWEIYTAMSTYIVVEAYRKKALQIDIKVA